MEPTFELYIRHLIQIFDEIKRVLKKSGTCWVVLGDTYSQSGAVKKQYKEGKNRLDGVKKVDGRKVINLPPKCLCSIPQRFQIAMCDNGWCLRNVVIWHKPSCLPSSTKDRLTVDFEYVLFFTKNRKYFFDYKAIMEPQKQCSLDRLKSKHGAKRMRDYPGGPQNNVTKYFDKPESEKAKIKMRHKRTVWSVNPKPYKEAHFACYPPALIKPMILAGAPKNGIVLDPFGGSGITAQVALENGRKCISIDLKPEYMELHKKRLRI